MSRRKYRVHRSSFPERNAEQQGLLVHHKPIQYLSFPFLIINTRGPGKSEVPQNPAEHHPHLHQCEILTCTVCRAVRKGNKRGSIVFASRRTLAEPSFR